MEEINLRTLRGLVATVVLGGSVDPDYAACLMEARSWCDRHDFHSIEWRSFHAVLVEAGRDAVVEHALRENYDWVIQIDADATFPPNVVEKLVESAYVAAPDADVVGAYCQLKGSLLPTIDSGTGTWEPWFPGEGIVEVIRTGGHCHLAKTRAYQRVSTRGPWYRTRQAMRAIDALSEVDGLARQRLSGQNPFARSGEWQTLVDAARRDAASPGGSVGEDSAFCDALKAAGGRIFVNTDIVTGHVARTTIGPNDLKERLAERARILRLASGLLA